MGALGFGMDINPEHEKLDELGNRIREAEGKTSAKPDETSAGAMKASNIGYEFLGTVLACAVIGFLIDRYLHTKPWGLLGMVMVGFIAGIANVWRTMNGYDQSVGLHKRDEK